MWTYIAGMDKDVDMDVNTDVDMDVVTDVDTGVTWHGHGRTWNLDKGLGQ
jgi:hypothetical protein